MLDYAHNGWLVAASLAIILMAGFTGLSLTRGASQLDRRHRKLVVLLAAMVLGGGIWSMHFVAMLGLQLPILFFYDALITLISALVAILMVGLALLLLHFRDRSPSTVLGAGAIVGLGIVVMHYIGMTGMQLCRPVYGPGDIALATGASVLLSMLAIWVAYDRRGDRNILIGTGCFGLAVFSVHFLATDLTDFMPGNDVRGVGPRLDNEVLAMGVTISAFVICWAFLLTGVNFLDRSDAASQGVLAEDAPTTAGNTVEAASGTADADAPSGEASRPQPANRAGVPFEREGQTFFAQPRGIAAIRAEGHYTVLYLGEEQHFCTWSITEAEKRLIPLGFVRVHRSYLINPAHVSRFERNKDNGTCYFEGVTALSKVPVSRSRLPVTRKAFGI